MNINIRRSLEEFRWLRMRLIAKLKISIRRPIIKKSNIFQSRPKKITPIKGNSRTSRGEKTFLDIQIL